MRSKTIFKVAALAGVFMLAGCASNVAKPNQYPGFLKNYSDLKEGTSASGKPVLRWIDPKFSYSHYDSIVYEPVTYYPVPKPNSQVGQKALDDIRNYTNLQLKAALAKKLPLVDKPGPHSLIFHGAITAVNSSNEELQFYEVIPVAMIVAGTQMATGHRTMNTSLFFEGEMVDASTGKPVIKVVRKGAGKDLNNASASITVDTIKHVIDEMVIDTVSFDPNMQK